MMKKQEPKPDLKSKTGKLEILRKILGARTVRLLQSGKVTLQIWRRSSPHNWFVEGPRGALHWHSDDKSPRPNLGLFELIKHSPTKIVTGRPDIIGSDEGAPELSNYRLKPLYCS